MPDAAVTATPTAPAGWLGALELGLALREGATRIAERRHRGPMLVQRPFYPEGRRCAHIYLLHPPGGLVGGDRLDCRVRLEADSHGLITTPAAGKAYRVDARGRRQDQHSSAQVGPGAALEWLPQETIAFNGANLDASTHIALAASARVFGWDMLCLGRPAAGETFRRGHVRQRLELWREGRPLLLDRGDYEAGGDILQAAWGLGGQPVLGTLFAHWPQPDTDTALALARETIAASGYGGRCGATLVSGVLLVRCLGADTEAMRHLFIRLWQALRPLVIGRQACPPRIWNT
jgi:urease accessory protein